MSDDEIKRIELLVEWLLKAGPPDYPQDLAGMGECRRCRIETMSTFKNGICAECREEDENQKITPRQISG